MIPWAVIAQKIAGAAGETAQVAAPILQSLGKAATAQRRILRKDTAALEGGALGYSEAKKRQMVEQAMAQARAQGLSGQQLAQVGSQAMQAANTDSEQQALIRRQQVLRRIQEQAARNAANWQQGAAHVGGMLGAEDKGGEGAGLDLSSLAAAFGK